MKEKGDTGKRWTKEREGGHRKEKVDTDRRRWTQEGEGGQGKEKVDRERRR
jgi:hypothetical protein